MYLEMATEEDKKMVEDRKADADGILIFVRPSRLLGPGTSITARSRDGNSLIFSQGMGQKSKHNSEFYSIAISIKSLPFPFFS